MVTYLPFNLTECSRCFALKDGTPARENSAILFSALPKPFTNSTFKPITNQEVWKKQEVEDGNKMFYSDNYSNKNNVETDAHMITILLFTL